MVKDILRGYASYILLALVSACIGCYIGYNLHDYGGGAGSPGQQVESAIRANQKNEASAGRIADSADRISNGIEQAQDGIGRAQDSSANSEQLISECQQILERVRSRGGSHPPSN